MVRKTLAITGAPLFILLFAMLSHLWRAPRLPRRFHLVLLLSFTLLVFTLSEACPSAETHHRAECDAFGSGIFRPLVGFEDIVGDANSDHEAQSSAASQSTSGVCTDTCLFCFLSPLGISGSQSDTLFSVGLSNKLSRSRSEKNWLSDYGIFELQDGRKILCLLTIGEGMPFSVSSVAGTNVSSCRLPIDIHVRLTEVGKFGSFTVSFSIGVEISPKLRDWGDEFLLFPSTSLLAEANKCNNNIVHTYGPFGVNKQFYPCKYSEVLLLLGAVGNQKSREILLLCMKDSTCGFISFVMRPCKEWDIGQPYKENSKEMGSLIDSQEIISGAIFTRLRRSSEVHTITIIVPCVVDMHWKAAIYDDSPGSSTLITGHSLCEKSVFWEQLKSFFLTILVVASLMFLLLHRGFFHDHSFYEDKFCTAAEFDRLLRSIGDDMRGKFANGQDNSFKDAHQKEKSISAVNVSESAHNKLTVKTGNGKKKHRKKKKKKDTVSGLMGPVEFSSSQSGNSTPTSPRSPFPHSPEPDLSREDRNWKTRLDPLSKPASISNLAEPEVPVFGGSPKVDPSQVNPFARSARSALPSKQQNSIHKLPNPKLKLVSPSPQQKISKPVLSHSATFPSRVASTVTGFGSPLSLHARAPGSKPRDQEIGKEREMQTGVGKNELRYDIWGDHLSVLDLLDRFKGVNGEKNIEFGDDDESVSFFAKGPQTFFGGIKLNSL